MSEKLIEVEIEVVERKTKEGKKFLSYSAFKKDGTRIDARFVKDAFDKAPATSCVVAVRPEDMNVSNKYRYPRLYIQDIVEVKPINRAGRNLDDFI